MTLFLAALCQDPEPALAGLESSMTLTADSWPQWRGPLGTGTAPNADPPISWSETANVRWKTPLPGLGHSSPIVWGDLVFVTTAIPYGEELDPVPDDMPGAHDNALVTRSHEFAALAIDRHSGEVRWRRALKKQLPHQGRHGSGTLASNSPVTDGEHLFAYFGSIGLFCLDYEGELVWEVDFGDMQVKHGHGEGSSVVLHGDTLVVNWDHEGKSFLVALDKLTGVERWRMDRDEVTSWSTPIVALQDGRAQLIVAGTQRVRSYDLANGEVIWECGGLSHNIVASPVASDGIVIVGSSYEKRAMFAILLAGSTGDITGTKQVIWKRRRRTPYVPSPLLHDGWVYFLNHYQGVLSRVKVTTGEEPAGPVRLDGLYNIYASPVAAQGRVYITDRDGTTLVVDYRGAEPKLLSTNSLDDQFSASAALVGRELFLRGERFLYCIADDG